MPNRTADEQRTIDLFVQWTDRYYHDPILFVKEVLGAEPEHYQAKLLVDVANGVRKISARSGHGVGKTTMLAWVIVWHACTRFPQKTVCTAPTSAQLFDALQSEVYKWLKKLPPTILALFELKAERVELVAAPEESFISFRTAKPDTPEILAGIHSEHMLVVFDEASGIHEKIFETSMGSMSGHHAYSIMAGNPVRTSGTFYDSHHKLRGDGIERGWKAHHISCLDSPRVGPGLARDAAEKYGEHSNAYRVRVLGEFPTSDDDTVIPLDLATAALTRDVKAHYVRQVWGLDCARFGMDTSALAKRQGNVLVEPIVEWRKLNTMQLTGLVMAEYAATPDNMKPVEVNVDTIGIGAGVADRLRELGVPARDINVSESPALGALYANLRSELWFKGKAWLENLDCNLANDELLVAELVGPKYDYTSSGKIQVETKKKMKERGVHSPNRADAFLLTLATDAVIATHGSNGSSSWSKPLGGFLSTLV